LPDQFLFGARFFGPSQKPRPEFWLSPPPFADYSNKEPISNEKIAFFEGKQITSLLAELPPPGEDQVMGVSSSDKWIEIDLSEQKLVAWDGGNKFLETPISSGKKWTPTPTGEYKIWAKMKRSQRNWKQKL